MHCEPRQERLLNMGRLSKPSGLGNEQGIALVMALVMLLVLGMLGALSLSTSTTEIHIAGNYRTQLLSFYGSSAQEGFGPGNPIIADQIRPFIQNWYPGPPIAGQFEVQPAAGCGLCETRVQVRFICRDYPPRATVYDQNEWLAYHYVVTIIGRSGANNSSEHVIESTMIRMVPRSTGQDPDC